MERTTPTHGKLTMKQPLKIARTRRIQEFQFLTFDLVGG